MKVLIADIVKSPSYGGSGPHRYELTRSLSNYVNVFCFSNDVDLDLNKSNVHYLVTSGKVLRRINYVVKIVSSVLTGKYDIIYLRNLYMGILLLPFKILIKSKYVVEINSITKDEYIYFYSSSSLPYKISSIFLAQIELLVAKKSDSVITVTEGIKKRLIEEGIIGNNIYCISNGADLDRFKIIEYSKLDYLRTKHSLNGFYVIFFHGTLVGYQGLSFLIKSAPLVIESVPNVKFIIVGDGVLLSKLLCIVDSMGISDYFIFTGRVSYDDVPSYINLADVCVAPFISDRNEKIGLSPLKIYEYMACSKPIVASDIKGVGDMLREYNTGISCPPEDQKLLAQSLIKLLNDENLRIVMGNNGRKICEQEYSWDKVAMKSILVFNELL